MTRDDINRLPLWSYRGEVVLLDNSKNAHVALRDLENERCVGFDTETRPTFRKGQKNSPSLLQLAGTERVYLIQLHETGFSEKMAHFLASSKIIKAGVAVGDDIAALRELREFAPGGFVDLGKVARVAGIRNHGLRGLAAALLGFRISKQAQRSNWARKKLTASQVRYAATDAWISRELYLSMEESGCIATYEAALAEAEAKAKQASKAGSSS